MGSSLAVFEPFCFLGILTIFKQDKVQPGRGGGIEMAQVFEGCWQYDCSPDASPGAALVAPAPAIYYILSEVILFEAQTEMLLALT
jgi:hypothetical protein